MFELEMNPATGSRRVKWVGDSIRFTLTDPRNPSSIQGLKAYLRTTIGRGKRVRQDIIDSVDQKREWIQTSWTDIPMRWIDGGWEVSLRLTEPGYYLAKAFLLDSNNRQIWPQGQDAGVSVHPSWTRSGNILYCAFPRMFGRTKELNNHGDADVEPRLFEWDKRGYSVIPPSGTLRDLKSALPHIMDRLGARIIHLLPVNPVPTTFARMGRYGSPYACLDLTAIDPALVEFDKKTTGVEQFMELTHAVHARGGRVFLDMVVNHTGWGSSLYEDHPEWFRKDGHGTFISPGAWGTTWEDLVELDHTDTDLWRVLADSFLVWRRRGVDGFRCDAGYKVPMPVWRYIVARVQDEFPDTLFLLEGLGGGWEDTARLLTDGGMQWAYSELFQEYSAAQLNGYLGHAITQSGSCGLLVNYSETHDNNRLASEGREWSLLRNRLCALTSPAGAYGFTCGVEWLAGEKIKVHGSTGMNWGNPENIVEEIAQLNRLLQRHPCFQAGSRMILLSERTAPAVALLRLDPDEKQSVLILINPDKEKEQSLSLKPFEGGIRWSDFSLDLLGQPLPMMADHSQGASFQLPRASVYCLSRVRPEEYELGSDLSRRRTADWAFSLLNHFLPCELMGDCDWRDLADLVEEDPFKFLSVLNRLKSTQATRQDCGSLTSWIRETMTRDPFPCFVIWSPEDADKTTMAPQGHLVVAEAPFEFEVALENQGETVSMHARSIQLRDVHLAVLCPGDGVGRRRLKMVCWRDGETRTIEGGLEILGHASVTKTRFTRRDLAGGFAHALTVPKILLTNGRGGMARIPADFFSITSKYDCVLGANLNPNWPEDRHVFVKRLRMWAMVDGFLQPLDRHRLLWVEPGPPARWRFELIAGDGKKAWLDVLMEMLKGENTVVCRVLWKNPEGVDKPVKEVCLTVRPDIEDRNFHTQTERNGAAEHHFASHTRALQSGHGFEFTPSTHRRLQVFTPDPAEYHPQAEWPHPISHAVESSRGQPGQGEAFSPGWFEAHPCEGAVFQLILTSETQTKAVSDTNPLDHSASRVSSAVKEQPQKNADLGSILKKAIQAYVVNRDDGKTVIAGYPWFLDWGRDSLICARGMIAADMDAEVLDLLRVFARFEENGTLPNSIHGDNASNRDTSDAPLWFSIVLEELLLKNQENPEFQRQIRNEPVDDKGRMLIDMVAAIAKGYIHGTPNGIRIDPDSGLVWSPSHFTWMDTNYPAGTPRMGYPIEIQALWIRLLRFLKLERVDVEGGVDWEERASRAESAVNRLFWVEEKGYYADCLQASRETPAGLAVKDAALRSNALFMASLGVANKVRSRKMVEAALRHLVVPGGIRSLAPWPVDVPLEIRDGQGHLLNDPGMPYWGRYEGDEDTRRKPAYHNGTAWTWPFPSVCEAMLQAWEGDPATLKTAKAYLCSAIPLIESGCLGQIPEVLDGNAPHQQRGCDAQAWGVTEAYRVWAIIEKAESKHLATS